MLSKINGEVEVLQFQINNFQEREKVLYQEINDRITILENNLQSKDDIKLPSSNDPINQLIDNQLSETQENINQAAVLENNIVKDIQEDSLVEDFPPPEDLVSTNVPPLIDKSIELDAFDEAKASLMGAKYKDSFSSFDRFISTYPKSEKIADANYFLGYSQFALKNYNAAIKTYSKLKELYPNSKIIPDAIYGIANCEIQLAKIANAKKTLRELIRQYPDAEILSKAKRRLKALESINL